MKREEIRILIVEDNPVDRELIRTHLKTLGLTQIQEAESGTSAQFKIKNAQDIRKPFHIILSDWMMPGQDGFALLKSLRSDHQHSRTGIVMVTSVSDQAKVKDAIREGVDDFVIKPIDPKLLTPKIERLITRIMGDV